jgi:hypothetical protein
MGPSIYANFSSTRISVALLASAMLAAPALARAAEPPEYLWSRAFTATAIDAFHAFVDINGVFYVPTGGVVIVGEFHGSTDFGGGPLVGSVWTDTDRTVDVYGAAFDALGRHRWSRVLARIDNAGYYFLSAAVDESGHIVLAGSFDAIDFDGAVLTSTFSDAFVAKFHPDGTYMWSKKFGVDGPWSNRVEDVAIDANGDIVLVGSMSGEMDFGGGIIQSLGTFDVFLVKLDPAGGHIWSRQFGAIGEQEGHLVSISGNGGVSMAGLFTDSIDLGGGALVADQYQQEIFMAAFDTLANHTWSRMLSIGPPGSVLLEGLASSHAGDVGLSAYFFGSIDLGGEVLSGNDYFVAQYDPGGAFRRVFRPHSQYVANFAYDGNERLMVAGSFTGVLDLGGQTLRNTGERDGYVARFDADGACEWALQLSGNATVHTGALAVGSGENLWLTGSFTDGIDFGDVEHEGATTFLARFGVLLPEPTLVISLFQRTSSVEIRWSVTTEQPFETLSIVRHAGVHEESIFSGPFESGEGSYIDSDVRAGQRYQYELVVTNPEGTEFRSSATVTMPVFANSLEQNAPNPFVPTTSIAYSLSERASIVVSIFDVAGALVRRIEQGARDPGEYAIEWDGRDDLGHRVGSGVYFYRLEGIAGVAPRKMVLLK